MQRSWGIFLAKLSDKSFFSSCSFGVSTLRIIGVILCIWYMKSFMYSSYDCLVLVIL